jgi:peptide/nickel transport system permease protein
MRFWLPVAILALWIGMALLGPLLPLQPDVVHLPDILTGPGPQAWLGYDDLGRPVWDRLVVGARTSFLVALWVVTISVVVGTVIGSLSGYIGGRLDHLIVRVIDILLAFPGILLAIAIAGVMGPGIDNVIIALSVVGWVGFARLARAQVLSQKQREYVTAAVALGANRTRILFTHLLPMIAAPLIVEGTFAVAGVVIAEAGLSYLGLGVQPPAASWGSMIRDGARYMLVAPHMVLAPGIAMMLVVLAVNLLGDRLRDWIDVRTRTS